jgi:O-antigen ligase
VAERVGISGAWCAQNIMVGYILPVIVISLTLFFITSHMVLKIVLLFYAFYFVYILFLSQTRTGWISLSVSLIALMILSRKRLKYIMFVSLIAILFLAIGELDFIQQVVKSRLIDQTIDNPDSSLQARYSRWDNAIATFKQYPLTGSGWGGYLPLIAKGRVADKPWPALPRWHNCFFEILSQLGIFGVLAFYWIWLKIGKFALVSWKSANDKRDTIILAGLISAVFSVFVYSMGEQQFFRIQTASLSWFLVGLMIAYGRLTRLQFQGAVSIDNEYPSNEKDALDFTG